MQAFFCEFRSKMSAPDPAIPAATLAELGTPPPAYRRLQEQLRQTSWVCQGTVVSRRLLRRVGGRMVKKGPYYLWTRKVKGRTVCVAISKAQYCVLVETIANNRRLQRTIERMQALSFKTILQRTPGVMKRK
jgi:hypothetical protein